MLNAIQARLRRWKMTTLKPFGTIHASTVRVSFADQSLAIAEAMAKVFHDVPSVEIIHGNLLDVTADALVSPANSFGDMSGGIDKAIDDFYQGEAQRRLVSTIGEYFFGELPVGMAIVLELPSKRFPFMIAAPTMRIPGTIAGSINAFLAMRAVFVAMEQFNRTAPKPIGSIAVPGLGTGVGGLHAADAAHQMRTAYDAIAGGQWRLVQHPIQAPYATR